MEALRSSTDTLFILLGAVMVLAMHAGFAFLEVGTVRRKNQVNALMKILVDFAVSTVAYFFVGYAVAYGTTFFAGAPVLAQKSGYELVRFFFLLTFAAAIPAIISGGIAERARFNPQIAATLVLVGFVYPFFEGIAWNGHFGAQAWLKGTFGAEFHDFAGSVVVHAMGGWIALVAVLLLGPRRGRYNRSFEHPSPIPSNKPEQYRFVMPTTNHVFLPGHRMMVQIQSTWFPLYDRNPQTYVPNIFFAKPADYVKATQTVYRSTSQASAVWLPVVK